MKKVVFIFFAQALFSILTFNVFSQAVCPIRTLRVNKVNGKVVFKDKNAKPITDIKLELRKTGDKETLISTSTTDEKGLFEFRGIRKGEYLLIADFIINGSLLLKYRAVVKVKKTNSTKLKPSILIRFGGDCWETEAVTVK